MRPRVLLTRPERAFSAHRKATGSCVFAWCLSRDPPCRRRRFRRSQPLGSAHYSSREPRQPEGTQCRGQSCSSSTEERAKRRKVLHSPPPTLTSHHSAVPLCLFNSVSCPKVPPETCHGLSIAEQSLCPRAAFQATACCRGKSPSEGEKKKLTLLVQLFCKQVSTGQIYKMRVNMCWGDLTLKHTFCPSGGNICDHVLPPPSAFAILKTWQELSSRGTHWSYFCGHLYPGSI